MKRSIGIWQFTGFALTTLGGTLLHFLYEWLGDAVWIAPFSGVNESTWEHMKLLFWPTFIFAITEFFFFRELKSFWCIKLRGVLLGLISVPALFYTARGIVGKTPDWINIAIFFVAAAVMYFYEWRAFKSEKLVCKHPVLNFCILCAIAILFIVFTFRTPEINIFKDPLTGGYGI